MLHHLRGSSRSGIYKHACFFRLRVVKKIIISGIFLGLLAFFYRIDPESTWWIPKCPFYHLTGLQCPACGTQRAIHHLLHFHLREAAAFNPFLFVSMPYLAALAWVEGFGLGKTNSCLRTFCYNKWTIYLYLAFIILWWIGRNLLYPAG